jgi:predicted component of type VI protein secretion system
MSAAPTPPDDLAATRVRKLPPKMALRGVSGTYFGKVIPLTGRLTIGRGSECDLVIDEAEMSRQHAVIEATPIGLHLKDLGSINGTFVNGAWVHNAELKAGDQIGFDRNRFLVESLADANSRSRGAAVAPPASAAAVPARRSSSGLWLMAIVVLAAAAAAVWYVTRGTGA